MAKKEVEAPLLAEPGDLGRLLGGIRSSIGYDLPQTADAMCLSEQVIKQLENEEFDLLPEPPYVRGYLRNYAKLAEADAEELITTYEILRGADPAELKQRFTKTSFNTPKKGISPVVLQLLLLAILLGALATLSMIPSVNQWINTTWNNFTGQPSSQVGTATDNPLLTGTMPVPTPLPIDKTTDSNKKPSSRKEIKADEKDNKQTIANQKNSQENPQSIKAEDTKPQEAKRPVPTGGTINLKLVFKKDVWMRIRDKNKKTVYEGQNSAGKEKSLSLKKPLVFRVGNAQGLSLFVNGQAVDIKRYTKGSVANFTLE